MALLIRTWIQWHAQPLAYSLSHTHTHTHTSIHARLEISGPAPAVHQQRADTLSLQRAQSSSTSSFK